MNTEGGGGVRRGRRGLFKELHRKFKLVHRSVQMENALFLTNVGCAAIVIHNMVKHIGEAENREECGDCDDLAQYVFNIEIMRCRQLMEETIVKNGTISSWRLMYSG